MQYYSEYIDSVYEALKTVVVSSLDGKELPVEEGLERWCSLTQQVKLANRTMYFAGNGASAMMASHMAVDASKNGGFRSLAFNDAAFLTAVSNDISYEDSFSMPLGRFGASEDVLVTISSSGNSPNILKAIRTARDLRMHVITLSGMTQQNKSRYMGDLNFYIPAQTYGLVEGTHQVLLHCWLDRYMDHFQEG